MSVGSAPASGGRDGSSSGASQRAVTPAERLGVAACAVRNRPGTRGYRASMPSSPVNGVAALAWRAWMAYGAPHCATRRLSGPSALLWWPGLFGWRARPRPTRPTRADDARAPGRRSGARGAPCSGAPASQAGRGKPPFAGYAPDSHAQAAPARPLCAWEALAAASAPARPSAEVANQRAWSGMKLICQTRA